MMTDDRAAEGEGWTEWHGGKCPVSVGTHIKTLRRSGYICGVHPVTQTEHDGNLWSHGTYPDRGTDIVAYLEVSK